jgi:hypothetical protein
LQFSLSLARSLALIVISLFGGASSKPLFLGLPDLYFRHRTDRAALVLQTHIDLQREERERKERLRAAVGADYLELVGLGMHALGDFLDPKGKQVPTADVSRCSRD